MKLVYCKNCGDLFNLKKDREKKCHCGKTSGKYLDSRRALVHGPYAIPIGFENKSFISSLNDQPEEGIGKRFDAFVIPKVCPTINANDQERGA